MQPRLRGMMGKDSAGGVATEERPQGGPGPGLPRPPSVTVHERMEVGDYDVAALSATGAEVLTGCLQENGYQVPEEGGVLPAPYVGQGW